MVSDRIVQILCRVDFPGLGIGFKKWQKLRKHGNPEPKAAGYMEVPGFDEYFINSEVNASEFRKKALELIDEATGAVVHRIENKPGQSGSVAVYNHLAQAFGGITREAALRGKDLSFDAQARSERIDWRGFSVTGVELDLDAAPADWQARIDLQQGLDATAEAYRREGWL